MAIKQHLTYDDLMTLTDDDYLHELVRGEIVRMPPHKGWHGRVENLLAKALNYYLDERAHALGWQEDQGILSYDLLVGSVAVGEFGMRFSIPDDPDQIRGADVCYLSPEQVARYEAAGSDEYFCEVPVLVAEVVSPSETATYIDEKVQDYLSGGARLVWLLFPPRRLVRVYHPDRPVQTVSSAEILDGGDVLPDFRVAVVRLFP